MISCKCSFFVLSFFFYSEERNIDFIVSVWTWGVSVGLILRWKTFVLCIKNCGKMGIASTIMSSKPIAPLWTYCNKNRSQNISMANIVKMSVIFQNAVNKIFWVLCPMFFFLSRIDMNVNGSIHVNGVSVVTWGSAPTLIRRWLIDNDFLNSLAFATFRGPSLFNRTKKKTNTEEKNTGNFWIHLLATNDDWI